MAKSSDGIPLRQRERFLPLSQLVALFAIPMHGSLTSDGLVGLTFNGLGTSVFIRHPRQSGTPADGMFGFIERLYMWVKRAAVNQLDPIGAPLHPPVAYIGNSPTPLVVPYVNTPAVKDEPWTGFGYITDRSDDRIDIKGWCALEDASPVGPVLPLFSFRRRRLSNSLAKSKICLKFWKGKAFLGKH